MIGKNKLEGKLIEKDNLKGGTKIGKCLPDDICIRDAYLIMQPQKTIEKLEDESEDEEDDDDEDEENVENMEIWLKEFPRTGEPLYLEHMTFHQAKKALLRERTQMIPHWQGGVLTLLASPYHPIGCIAVEIHHRDRYFSPLFC
eukprot:Tbor_TRINITY_DN5871_c1_g1::TRINITY_DN5871_c1_g1_i3::g.7116::m.7116